MPAKTAATIKPLEDGWQDVDPRMIFLTVQLSSVEASISAISKSILLTGNQQTAKKQASDQYRQGNELMDRKGGGPANWSEFYGRTAEKFFYRPTGRNNYYHTIVVLRPGQYDQTGDGTTAHNTTLTNRPPQFDYIYRANIEAQKQAEVDIAKLGNRIDKLTNRRRELENEQSTLWCRIAFRGAMSRAVMDDPIYQFNLKTENADARALQQREALQACIEFMRSSYRIIALADAAKDLDQAQFYAQLETNTAAARERLNERLIKLDQFAGEVNDIKQTLGKYVALSKRSRDVAKNIAEAYQLAADGDKADDKQRQRTFRELLQESLVSYSEIVLAEDECISQLAREWSFTPNFSTPLAESERRIEPLTVNATQPTISTVSRKPTTVISAAQGPAPENFGPSTLPSNDNPASNRPGPMPSQPMPQQMMSNRMSVPTTRSARPNPFAPSIPLTNQARNIMSLMYNPFTHNSEGALKDDSILELRSFGFVRSTERFATPAKFHFEAMTEDTNIRFRFGSRFIFNWEMGKDELRVDGGPISGLHKKGAGFVQPKVWHSFDLIVQPDSLRLIVDGKERYAATADFSHVYENFAVEQYNSIVKYRSITVSLP